MTTARFVALLTYSATLIVLALPRPLPQASVSQQETSSLPLSLRLAVEVLRAAESFSAVEVGYAGITPPEVLAWRVVLSSEDADSVFRALLQTGGRPTQLYSLSGLQFLVRIKRSDDGAYRKAVRAMRGSRELVWQTVGCISTQSSLGKLVREVDKGMWTREFIAGRLLGEH